MPIREYTTGTAIPSPDYDDFASFPVTYDVGVVELDEPRPMPTYGVLAPLGTAETLAGTAKSRNTNLVETVGYGIQSVQPHPADVETVSSRPHASWSSTATSRAVGTCTR